MYFYCRIWQGPFRVLITVIRAKVPKRLLRGSQWKGPHLVDISWSKYGVAVKLLTTVLLMQCWKGDVIISCNRSRLKWSYALAEKCKNLLISFSQGKPSSCFCRYEASCPNTAFKERPEGHFYVLLASSLPAHRRTGMRKEKGEQRWGQAIHHQQGQPTKPRNNFSGTWHMWPHAVSSRRTWMPRIAGDTLCQPWCPMSWCLWKRVQAGFHVSPIKSVCTTCSCIPHTLSHTPNT